MYNFGNSQQFCNGLECQLISQISPTSMRQVFEKRVSSHPASHCTGRTLFSRVPSPVRDPLHGPFTHLSCSRILVATHCCVSNHEHRFGSEFQDSFHLAKHPFQVFVVHCQILLPSMPANPCHTITDLHKVNLKGLQGM